MTHSSALDKALVTSQYPGMPFDLPWGPCPRCGCEEFYVTRTRPGRQCKKCKHRWHQLSGTIWSYRKKPVGFYTELVGALCKEPLRGYRDTEKFQTTFKTLYSFLHEVRTMLGNSSEDTCAHLNLPKIERKSDFWVQACPDCGRVCQIYAGEWSPTRAKVSLPVTTEAVTAAVLGMCVTTGPYTNRAIERAAKHEKKIAKSQGNG